MIRHVQTENFILDSIRFFMEVFHLLLPSGSFIFPYLLKLHIFLRQPKVWDVLCFFMTCFCKMHHSEGSKVDNAKNAFKLHSRFYNIFMEVFHLLLPSGSFIFPYLLKSHIFLQQPKVLDVLCFFMMCFCKMHHSDGSKVDNVKNSFMMLVFKVVFNLWLLYNRSRDLFRKTCINIINVLYCNYLFVWCN